MSIIAPSLLSANFLELAEDIKVLSSIDNLWIHLDIMDGHYVPNLTFGAPVLKGLKDITPHPLDAHLMVTNPTSYIEPLKNIGIYNFTFHWEAVTHQDRLIQELKKNFKSVGVSLNPATALSEVPLYILKEVDVVLIMSVNPGFGGQSFIPSSLEKIEQLALIRKDNKLDFKIQIDGGVSDTNASKLISAGADILVAGSFIFKNGKSTINKNIKKLRDAK